MRILNYLALGDSYTIGEQVAIAACFPYQTIQLLRKHPVVKNDPTGDILFSAPEIVAKTGWTTDELDAAINNTILLPQYDFVTLLIGVNNQYRGRSNTEFKIEFGHLLQRAIQFAGNNVNKVFVLSIPDWGVTPFAAGKDTIKISQEIDQYNSICESASIQYQIHFIDVTSSQRADSNKTEFLAADQLHPSAKEYAKWAVKLCNRIIEII